MVFHVTNSVDHNAKFFADILQYVTSHLLTNYQHFEMCSDQLYAELLVRLLKLISGVVCEQTGRHWYSFARRVG
jgi:hypothetical protein